MKQSLTSPRIPLVAVSNHIHKLFFQKLRASERLRSVFPPYSAVVIMLNNPLASYAPIGAAPLESRNLKLKSLVPGFSFRIWSVAQGFRRGFCQCD